MAQQDAAGFGAMLGSCLAGATLPLQPNTWRALEGARSMVRDVIGAKLEGTYGFLRNYVLVFHAPGLAQAHAHGPAIKFWQVNGEVYGLDVDAAVPVRLANCWSTRRRSPSMRGMNPESRD